ncbi:hypothetical protein [Streptomyces sp. CB03238]|uniref:hypothetical protein n=1 Tax=Streptomyces sp. CB03238 TaxID=1907777 RepID=UPI0015C49FB9|nr:hypothetical protein [Streptomyces sp. CB03238]
MGSLTFRRILAAVMTCIGYGCAAGAGALLALVTIGAVQWSLTLFLLLAGTALNFSIAAEILQNPKKGPKHAAR